MGLLEFLIVLILVFWLLGMIVPFGGSLIYLLLVVALILLVYRLFVNRNNPI